MPPSTIRILLPAERGRSVPALLGRRLRAPLAGLVARIAAGRRIALIADARVARRWAVPVARTLASAGLRARRLRVRGGEAAKTREAKAALEDRLLADGFGRDTLILAMGGGSVLDLAGFTAATYLRGVPWVALPTTLIAMADASVGGKTGVNHPAGKNLIGAFHHPAAIVADMDWLATLPAKDFRGGLAEAVKMAAGLSAARFARIEADAPALRARRPAALGRLVAASIRMKAAVVLRDEREGGLRQVLNFGHTVGHALEAASGFRMPHGDAVSIGMMVEARIARLAGRFPAADLHRLGALLARLGLPVAPPRGADPRDLLRRMRADKKTRAGRVRYALPLRLGKMDPEAGWARPVPDRLVLEAWRAALAPSRPPNRW